ncbi:unnamed protein product [Linum tenue]|uniref:Transposase n=1 Tax=Linum tenue TaxID=586396 RepID=A0AAV0HGN3_9ROSI|nr:unnamed protein product [Linum tenue]
MLFTYVIAGWEGTANDARILMETIANPDNDFPMPPKGMISTFHSFINTI